MAITFTKIDVQAELTKIASPFDKEIASLEKNLKVVKDKKQEASMKKTLQDTKNKRSEELGKKLAALQKTNSADAEKLFTYVQNAFIKAVQCSTKAQKAFEALKTNPAETIHLATLQSMFVALQPMPADLDQTAKNFVDAQDKLRSDIHKAKPWLIDDKHSAEFKKIRDKLITDNKNCHTKKNKVHELHKTLGTLYRSGEALQKSGTKSRNELVASISANLGKVEKLLTDMVKAAGATKLESKLASVISKKGTTDPGMAKTLQTMWAEFVSGDKIQRDSLKSARAQLDALKKAAEKLKDTAILKRIETVEKSYDSEAIKTKNLTEKIKEAGAIVQAAKKFVK